MQIDIGFSDVPVPQSQQVRNPNSLVAREVTSALDAYQEKAAFASRRADVFISARHSDYEYATQIYRFLGSRGLAVFFSEESLPQLGSSDYRREIDRALDEAQYMIVVTSSTENVQSSWVEAEWGFFINEKRSGRKSGNHANRPGRGQPCTSATRPAMPEVRQCDGPENGQTW